MSETRIEKRIVISGDTDIDHDQVTLPPPRDNPEPGSWTRTRTAPGPGSDPVSPFKALVTALSEARRQHPELSVTRVVIHKETEVSPDHVTSQVTGVVTGSCGCCMAALETRLCMSHQTSSVLLGGV